MKKNYYVFWREEHGDLTVWIAHDTWENLMFNAPSYNGVRGYNTKSGAEKCKAKLEKGVTAKPMREKTVEDYLVYQVRQRGGVAMKFTSPARRSVPDRIVLMPKGKIFFVELKAPGKKPTTAQEKEHALLRGLGFDVAVVDSRKGVDVWITSRMNTKR